MRSSSTQPNKIPLILMEIINTVWNNPLSLAFRRPVDYEKLNLYDYPMIIKCPMDLSTIKKKIKLGKYEQIRDFIKDLTLVWENCKTYNREDSAIYAAAKELQEFSKSLIHENLFDILQEDCKINNEKTDKIVEEKSKKAKLWENCNCEEKNELLNFKRKMLLNKAVKKFSEKQIRNMLKLIKRENIEAIEIVSDEKILVHLDKIQQEIIDKILSMYNSE